MTDPREALEDLRRMLSTDEGLRRRTLDAAASGELDRLTAPDEGTMDTEQISLRLPTKLLQRCDALAVTLQGHPDLAAMGRVTRAAVVRLALERGLQQLEQQHAPGGKRHR